MIRRAEQFVEPLADGGWRVAGSRVSLASMVHAYWDGLYPEQVAAEFPGLTLGQIYGAMAFYLENQGEVDRYLARLDQETVALRAHYDARQAAFLEPLRRRFAARKCS